jgi:hypothetical protein
MPELNIRPTHSAVKAYYGQLRQLDQLRLVDEGQVAPAFANLLRYYARQMDWTLAEKHRMQRRGRDIVVDGAAPVLRVRAAGDRTMASRRR